MLLLGLLLGSDVRQVRLLLWGTRTVTVGHLMSSDKRASTVMTSWLLAGLRLCHAGSQHQAGTVWLLGVGHSRVLVRQQAALLLALLLAHAG